MKTVTCFSSLTAVLLAACSSSNIGGADSGPAAIDTGPAVPGPPSSVAAAAVTVVSTVTTLAGSGSPAFADGTGSSASFNGLWGVSLGTTGDIYVGDLGNNRVRKVTPAGVVTTLAGSGSPAFADGTGSSASFWALEGVAVDASGDLYVADTYNYRIRKVTPAGVVTTLAGAQPGYVEGTGAAARFNLPVGVAVDAAGSVYVGDSSNQCIRKVTPAGMVTTLAGSGTAGYVDGTGVAASFNQVYGVAVDAAGTVYVSDSNNHRIRKVTRAGVTSTLAGSGTAGYADGAGAAASFYNPTGVAVDTAGNLYVAEYNNHRIRRVTPAGVVTTLAGSGTAGYADGTGTEASFNTPLGVAVDTAGNVYVGDSANNRLRKVTSTGMGQLAVTWSPPSTDGGSPITSYAASAGAIDQPTQTCATTGSSSCTIGGLTSGVAYSVSVIAINVAGTSVPSESAIGTPN